MTTLQQALKVRCPMCGSKAGVPCVYITPTVISQGVVCTNPDFGKPTKRPHNDRIRWYDRTYTPSGRKRKPEKLSERSATHPSNQRIAYQAMRAWQADENHKLRVWLGQNASIFQNPTIAPQTAPYNMSEVT